MKELEFRGELTSLNSIRNFLMENLKSWNLSEQDYYSIELSVLEICVNIMRYAYPGTEKGGNITIKAWHQEGKFYLQIRDKGVPFDPSKSGKPDLDKIIKTGQKGGLGIFLSKKLMDGFEYERKDNQNIITLCKCIEPTSSDND